jgi:hypothetical protein
MARRATIQLKVHRQIVQSIPLDDADIDCLIDGLRLVTPCTQRIDRLIDLLEQIRDGGSQGPTGTSRSLSRPAPRARNPILVRKAFKQCLHQPAQ